MSSFKAIEYFESKEGWPVKWMCESLGVSHSGYYAWKKHVPTAEELENEELLVMIRGYDDLYGHILGYRRMTGNINRLNGTSYSEKRIRVLMWKAGIRSVLSRKRPKPRKTPPGMVNENILNRVFTSSRPNEKWLTDVTEFKVCEGGRIYKIYLCLILDLYDRSVVGYTIGIRNDQELVHKTLDKALALNPEVHPLLHSDRGSPYTQKIFQERLTSLGIVHSMSRVGHCIDNGPMEGFWGQLKNEMFYPRRYKSRQELKEAIEKYINFYNNDRYQSRFGYQSPLEVRAAALETEYPVQYPIQPNRRIERYKASWKK